MAATGPKKLSLKHESILHFLLVNPTLSMREVAIAHGVTPAWLSQVIHSDAFKELRARRSDEVFEGAVLQGISTKLEAVASDTLDRLQEKVASCEDPEALSNIADRALNRLGFGTQKNGAASGPALNIQQNAVFMAPPGILEKAREHFGNGKLPDNIDTEQYRVGEEKTIELEVKEAIHASERYQEGAVHPLPSVHTEDSEERREAKGSSV